MLTLSSIFSSSDFIDEGFDRPRWCQGHASNDSSTSSYTTLRKYQKTPNTITCHENISEILLHSPYDQNPTTLVNITQLIPMNMTSPLVIDDYILSPDHTKVLLFTNSQKVWRLKTKGSYWILLLNDSNSKPYQLGLTLSNPNQLMFATFSPSYTKVAYVLEHNIYCEDILTHQITQLTFDGNENIINGTFDWVYEEEFHLRNGFRWAPDGEHIAYWQLDQSNVPIVHLVNNTDTVYPTLIPIHYPKTGDQNSTVRIGVVSITGDKTPKWIPVPCDGEGYHSSSNSYIADITYHNQSGQLIIQQINRLQNHLTFWSYDPASESLRILFEDQDEAWIDVLHEVYWINNGQSFLYISDRNGWKQIFLVNFSDSDQNRNPTALTPVGVDVESIQGIDENSGIIYYIASPDDPIRRYLYRVTLDGTESSRVTPESPEFTGTNAYSISKDGKFAIHTFSTAQRPPSFRWFLPLLFASSLLVLSIFPIIEFKRF